MRSIVRLGTYCRNRCPEQKNRRIAKPAGDVFSRLRALLLGKMSRSIPLHRTSADWLFFGIQDMLFVLYYVVFCDKLKENGGKRGEFNSRLFPEVMKVDEKQRNTTKWSM